MSSKSPSKDWESDWFSNAGLCKVLIMADPIHEGRSRHQNQDLDVLDDPQWRDYHRKFSGTAANFFFFSLCGKSYIPLYFWPMYKPEQR